MLVTGSILAFGYDLSSALLGFVVTFHVFAGRSTIRQVHLLHKQSGIGQGQLDSFMCQEYLNSSSGLVRHVGGDGVVGWHGLTPWQRKQGEGICRGLYCLLC